MQAFTSGYLQTRQWGRNGDPDWVQLSISDFVRELKYSAEACGEALRDAAVTVVMPGARPKAVPVDFLFPELEAPVRIRVNYHNECPDLPLEFATWPSAAKGEFNVTVRRVGHAHHGEEKANYHSAAVDPKMAVAAGALKAIVDDPAVKSRLAIALNYLRRGEGLGSGRAAATASAASRVQDYTDQLRKAEISTPDTRADDQRDKNGPTPAIPGRMQPRPAVFAPAGAQ